jgi:hypothetical protein
VTFVVVRPQRALGFEAPVSATEAAGAGALGLDLIVSCRKGYLIS